MKNNYEQIINKIISAALNSVDPAKLILDNVRLINKKIHIADTCVLLKNNIKIKTFCVGKAAIGMQYGLEKVLGNKISKSLIVTKNVHNSKYPINAEILQGDHPIPAIRSLEAGEKVFDFFKDRSASDINIIGISGGASALISSPAAELTLEDVGETNKLLISSGVPIQKINCIRKHLDNQKGGGLARLLFPAVIFTLIMSDVIDNSISNIGSGLTAVDESTFSDAVAILKDFKLLEKIPIKVKSYLLNGMSGLFPETVKSNEIYTENVNNLIIGSNITAIDAIEKESTALGLQAEVFAVPFFGEAKELGKSFAQLLIKKSKNRIGKKVPASVTVIGGESTVVLKGDGKGGRNLEMGLSAIEILDGIPNISMVCLATDGEDGVTNAAGVIVDGQTAGKAKIIGINPHDYLEKNDSYGFFEKVGGMIRTGPTGTNVNDLVLLFSW